MIVIIYRLIQLAVRAFALGINSAHREFAASSLIFNWVFSVRMIASSG